MMNTNNRSLSVGSFIKSYSRTGNQLTAPEIKEEEPDIKSLHHHGENSKKGLKAHESKWNRMEVVKLETTASVESLSTRNKEEPKRKKYDYWNKKQTLKFYSALSSCGTDFQMMETMFKNRTRSQLKSKFKREDRCHAELVSKALQAQIFDPTLFALSDSEEDKKPDLQVLKSTKLNGNSISERNLLSQMHKESN